MQTITRVHYPCKCVIEEEVDDQKTSKKFLLLNTVCDGHKKLASTTHKANHSELSKRSIALIEEAKTANLKQVDDLISNETRPDYLRDLILCRTQVLQHNEKITQEWNELVTKPHAFDSHIHEQIKKELN